MQFLKSLFIAILLCSCGFHVTAESIYAIDARQQNVIERGKLAGQLMQTDIQARLIVWNALLKEHLGKTGKELLDSLEHKTGWQAAIASQTPDLLEEIKAMAQAAEVNYYQLLSYNLAEEIMTIHADSYQSCTGFAAFLPDTAALAYNLDIPKFLHAKKRPFVLRTQTQYFILGFPGIVATSVVTPDFTVTTNSLPDLASDGKGLPLPFALRLIGRQESALNAVALIENLDLAVAQNFLLISQDSIFNIEKSASQTRVHKVQARDEPYFHTNFAQLNDNYSPVRETPTVCERFQSLTQFTQNLKRLNSVEQLLTGITATIDEETFFTLTVAYACGESQIQLFLPQSPEQNLFPF